LTDEQGAVVEAAQDGETLKVLAFAGTGKTATLKAVAESLPDRKMLYLAFNKSIQREAARKFPAHVECRTAHSLAYGAVGHRYKHRLGGRLWGKDLAEGEHYPLLDDRDPMLVGSIVLDTVRRFEHSADRKIGWRHVPRLYLATIPENQERRRRDFLSDIVRYATRLWEQLIDPEGQYPITHDTYLKMWQLDGPTLGYDTILFDEAQDASPVMLDVVNQQDQAQRIFVGDTHQQIYAWRGAIDALQQVMAPSLPLTQSFRFGEAVAELANTILAVKGERTMLKGLPSIPTVCEVLADRDYPRTVLCRTNAGLISHVLHGLDSGRRVAVLGGVVDAVRQLRAVYDLWRGVERRRRSHPLVNPFATWQAFVDASKTQDGAELKPLVSLAMTYTDRLEGVADRLEGCSNNERGADLVVSTVHKAKGREWDRVKLADDFRAIVGGEGKPSSSEVNLLYVAVTRAQGVIDVSGCSAVQRLYEVDDGID